MWHLFKSWLPWQRRHNRIADLQQRRQAVWEQRWSRKPGGRYSKWMALAMPAAIQQAIDDRWLTPGARLIDVGCGGGEIAGWLAEQGFDVLGIDFAPSAIALAQAAHPHQARLRFAVADITGAAPPPASADAVIDRGCLHVIPAALKPAYVRNVSQILPAGGKVLLLHKMDEENGATAADLEQELRRLFTPIFDFVMITDIVIARSATDNVRPPAPALALRLVKREHPELNLEKKV